MASNPLFWTALRYFGGCTFVGYVLLKAITPTDEYMKEKIGTKHLDSRIKSQNEEFLTKMKYVHSKSVKKKPD
ncbi:hypothetical protein NP493_246g03065 [Ridgeia piscesae]|uniref:Uncharacterized protein n=1 Tax=Ridgeia piscesae TaxID=27915 RepID=A0AAD9NZ65_RIDPI|nr:hypothetical protein NP493_246g03065 [Ridgeia piscesae]